MNDMDMQPLVALDLFAGTGWGVACQRLGIVEHGVELMPEAIATRTAAGMHTAYRDVWDGLTDPAIVPNHDVLIASPPCQTFSAAGKGAGRAALDDVLELIRDRAYQTPRDGLHVAAAHLDPRTALVLTPLAYAVRHFPTYLIWEQVPAVLPVWEACADVLRDHGYSVETAVLNAEQYGVPQTRRRAVLVARRSPDHVAVRLPAPTHSRYYPRDPARLDIGVLPWVSMADALGWAVDVVSAQSVAGEGRAVRAARHPGFTVTQTTSRVMRSNYGTGGDSAARGERTSQQPAPTVTSKIDRNHWTTRRPSTTIVGSFRPDIVAAPGWRKPGDSPRQDTPDSVRVTLDEAAVLQSYPSGFPFQGNKGKQFLQVGNAVPPLLAEAILRALITPA